MRRPLLTACFHTTVALLLASGSLSAQGNRSTTPVPRASDGKPDLTGVYQFQHAKRPPGTSTCLAISPVFPRHEPLVTRNRRAHVPNRCPSLPRPASAHRRS